MERFRRAVYIVILLDGATTTQVSIDTSAPGEHTILNTVTSPTSG